MKIEEFFRKMYEQYTGIPNADIATVLAFTVPYQKTFLDLSIFAGLELVETFPTSLLMLVTEKNSDDEWSIRGNTEHLTDPSYNGTPDNWLKIAIQYLIDGSLKEPASIQDCRCGVARRSKRGMANNLICCREGFIKLQLSENDLMSLRKLIKITIYETGAMYHEPFAILGYTGAKMKSADSAVRLALDTKGNGAFVTRRIADYWTRLI